MGKILKKMRAARKAKDRAKKKEEWRRKWREERGLATDEQIKQYLELCKECHEKHMHEIVFEAMRKNINEYYKEYDIWRPTVEKLEEETKLLLLKKNNKTMPIDELATNDQVEHYLRQCGTAGIYSPKYDYGENRPSRVEIEQESALLYNHPRIREWREEELRLMMEEDPDYKDGD
jgi:hypothetical protein